MNDSAENHPSPEPHKRRKRYSGTHPKNFQERYKELAPEKYPDAVAHVLAAGRTPAGTHVPIMVAEVMEHLAPSAGQTVADCTLGYGGHAEEFMRRIGPTGRLVGLDMDGEQLELTGRRLATLGVPLSLHHSNFAGLGKIIEKEGITGFDVIFADFGVSSMQVDDPWRGFSYKHDGPLDMRMDARLKRSAADVLATISVADLSKALLELADEEAHERIAWEIVQQQKQRPITRTGQLNEIVMAAKGVTPSQWRKLAGKTLHPSAKTFQALRILVNDELSAIKQLLRLAPFCLADGGRLGILTFHSGEDRLVKKAFREGVETGMYSAAADEVVRASAQEQAANPRSSPAKFRWARK